ncbi:hypothetical protein HMPREF1210_00913 [Paenisporosarcina sp. HGH0030]|uniref:hypothetical protein n=1 Tax=Paenisporosarcina sp. HGH0030 TaxID=1078085 RepID=UPI00034E44AE|nr:hypothetical protein [Paenisporosarcina sp. HGH0030]EPD53182.1 hypothetical protein HMPREF1210_00913 [Paenisporosarcina sp. HGH0030]
MKKISQLSLLILIAILLSGCMYPESERVENQRPDEEQLASVQAAVEKFQETTDGLLPIKTRDQDVDQYIKYPIDFEKIVPAYLSEIPPNSYENGGLFQYVIMDVEENPTVKLVDLRSAEKIRELNIKLGANGYGPIAEQVAENVYKLDYKIMGYKEEQTVPSPYSNVNLPLVATGDGSIYIDYSIELNRILQEDKPDVKPGEDIRYLLVDKYPVLPAYSLPYTVNEKNEPEFLQKEVK